jgi:Holliday junction DNA helicase RuvA
MITFLRGKLIESLPTQAIVEVNGVGYEVLIPLSSFDKLPTPGGNVLLLTHLAVREDAHVLYGFMTTAERELFRLLINTVSGIGPRIALNVLSGMNVIAFRALEAASDKHALSAGDQKINDAVLALMALGFKQPDAHDAVRGALALLGDSATVEQLVRACLKKGS